MILIVCSCNVYKRKCFVWNISEMLFKMLIRRNTDYAINNDFGNEMKWIDF